MTNRSDLGLIRIAGLIPDPHWDVCPKMLWIHYLIGVSHFAMFSENQPVTV